MIAVDWACHTCVFVACRGQPINQAVCDRIEKKVTGFAVSAGRAYRKELSYKLGVTGRRHMFLVIL